MTKFKRSTAAAALLMASAIPAFADTHTTPMVIPADVVVPADHILLQFEGMEGFYVVSYETAAELCDIDDEDFAEIAEDPATALIFCDELMTMDANARQTFIDDGRILLLADFDGDDMNGGTNADGAADVEGGMEADGEVDAVADAEADGDDELEAGTDADLDGEAGVDAGPDVGAEADGEVDPEVDAGVETDAGTEADAGAEADVEANVDADASVDTETSTESDVSTDN